MAFWQTIWILCIFFLASSLANVEKTIFLGPATSTARNLDLSSLSLLTPSNPAIRTQFHSKFPSSPSRSDLTSDKWFLLSDLNQGTRYEVRVCWPAVQPTAWELDVFTVDEVANSRELLLAAGLKKTKVSKSEAEPLQSQLLLRVIAQADYYTMNRTLMDEGLAVDVDIILDPYLFNIAPSSLIPTGIHIVIVGIIGFLIAKWVTGHVQGTANAESYLKTAKKQA